MTAYKILSPGSRYPPVDTRLDAYSLFLAIRSAIPRRKLCCLNHLRLFLWTSYRYHDLLLAPRVKPMTIYVHKYESCNIFASGFDAYDRWWRYAPIKHPLRPLVISQDHVYFDDLYSTTRNLAETLLISYRPLLTVSVFYSTTLELSET